MCWSGEASAVLATIGLGSTVYMAVKKEKKDIMVHLWTMFFRNNINDN